MATTPEDSPGTGTGTWLSLTKLLTSVLRSPQQETAPPKVSAHALWPRVETATTPDDNPMTGTGTWLSVVELLPSSPCEFIPQHWTAPPATTAQVFPNPALMAILSMLALQIP